ncbi:hypothetical protein CEXT_154421 [Caerostris extrusa]|uniref:Uncharacterized protein n=1 Tax=Caerostris extrusa TaxID=172846 RepID=A0AAV4XH15_CAEEX|nr:hypothetical protein CEXT_154421 [Caerostris extrusa]
MGGKKPPGLHSSIRWAGRGGGREWVGGGAQSCRTVRSIPPGADWRLVLIPSTHAFSARCRSSPQPTTDYRASSRLGIELSGDKDSDLEKHAIRKGKWFDFGNNIL